MKILLFLLTFSSACLGIAESSARIERHIRPGEGGNTTPVLISFYVVDLLDINDVDRTISVDYIWLMMWNDPRLSDANYDGAKGKLDLSLEDIWHPHLTQVNIQSSSMKDSILNIDGEGNVAYRVRLNDTFTAPLDLHRFPFDSQNIKLKFLSTLYNADEIDLQWNEERSGHLDTFSLPGWTFKEVSHQFSEMNLKGSTKGYCGIDLHLQLKRNSGFYFWKVFVPLSFIAFMAWTVFWIDPANFSGQVAISTSSVITLIAFQLSLTELLPKISYLTEIDVFALATSFMVFLALGEAIFTARLAKMGKHNLSLIIDKWMRCIYPGIFFILLLFMVF